MTLPVPPRPLNTFPAPQTQFTPPQYYPQPTYQQYQYSSEPSSTHGHRRKRSQTDEGAERQTTFRTGGQPPQDLPYHPPPPGAPGAQNAVYYQPYQPMQGHPAQGYQPPYLPHPSQPIDQRDAIYARPPVESFVGKEGYPEQAAFAAERKRFSTDEDEKLKSLKEDFTLSWNQIAEFFPGRKSGTLQVRYCTKLKAKQPVEWTPDMDEKLIESRKEWEKEMWKYVAGKFGNNVNAQLCKERYEELEEMKRAKDVEGSPDPEALA